MLVGAGLPCPYVFVLMNDFGYVRCIVIPAKAGIQ